MSSIFNQIKYSFPVKFIKVKNYDIAYIDEGNSENVLLFIHGLGSYLKAWERNIPVLKKHFRCIALDLPGYGKSSKQVHPGEVSFYTNVLNEFVAKLELEKVTLVGHSMGGQIAIAYVLAYPKSISHLVLTAPAGFETFSDEDIDLIGRMITPDSIFNTSNDQIISNYNYNFFKMPDSVESMIADRIAIKNDAEFYNHCVVVSNSLSGLLKAPVVQGLNEIRIPTLVLFGAEDQLIPNKSLHQITTKEIALLGASHIKNSKLILIEKCGHFLQYEKFDEFNSYIISFLN